MTYEADTAWSLAEAEQRHIATVMLECAGNVSAAARRLGVFRSTLQRKLRGQGELARPWQFQRRGDIARERSERRRARRQRFTVAVTHGLYERVRAYARGRGMSLQRVLDEALASLPAMGDVA